MRLPFLHRTCYALFSTIHFPNTSVEAPFLHWTRLHAEYGPLVQVLNQTHHLSRQSRTSLPSASEQQTQRSHHLSQFASGDATERAGAAALSSGLALLVSIHDNSLHPRKHLVGSYVHRSIIFCRSKTHCLRSARLEACRRGSQHRHCSQSCL